MQIVNTTKKTLVAQRGQMADTIGSRLIGLLNRRTLASDEALVLTDCRGIHMFFMRFAIDVIFLDRNQKVIRLVCGIKPFQVSPYIWNSYFAIEGSPGMIENSRTAVGDEIQFQE